jgi:hypothetical protein
MSISAVTTLLRNAFSGLFLLLLFAVLPIYAQDGKLPEKEAWPLVSIGVPRLHASFPYEPKREDRSVFSNGNLIKASLYTLYIRELDWKFEVLVIPHGQKPKSKDAALWAENETNRTILTTGASVMSRRECKDPLLNACRSYDLVTPDGLLIRGRTGVYESYVITLTSSGKYPFFNEALAEHFLSSLVLPRGGVPLTAPAPVTAGTNVLTAADWFRFSDESFGISFPARPQVKGVVLKGDNFDIPLQSWQYIKKSDDIAFQISRHQPAVDIADPKLYLEHAMNNAVSMQKGTLLMQQWLSTGETSALEFVYSLNKDIFKCRYVLHAGILYQIISRGKRNIVLGPVGFRFFDSFALREE